MSSASNDLGRVYLNNAATSHPKPRSVADAVVRALTSETVEPGRGGGGIDFLVSCRAALSTLFNVKDPNFICLLPSATHALNMVICGLLWDGGHAVTSSLEHNSVLRPLNHMVAERGAAVTVIDAGQDGRIDPTEISKAMRRETRLIAVTHASNVTGVIQPIESVAEVAATRDVPLLIDAAQSAGAIPLDYAALSGRIYVAFAGHKGLLGPMGTGGLIVPDDALKQTFFGGTGIRSESPLHPHPLPLRHEAGTPNVPGFAGLGAGVSYVLERGVEQLGAHRAKLVGILRQSLEDIGGIVLSPLSTADGRAGVVSFTLRGIAPEAVGFALDEAFEISVRTGLHCAPLIHETLGTAPGGTVRVSLGPFNTISHIERFVTAVKEVCA